MRKHLLLTVVLLCAFNLIANCQESFQAAIKTKEHFSFLNVKKRPSKDYYYTFTSSDFPKSVVLSRATNKEIIWSKLFTLPYNPVTKYFPVIDTYITNDNGCIITMGSGTYDSCFLYIFKCDSTGKVVWKKLLNKVNEIAPYNFDVRVCEANDGSIYFVVDNRYFHFDVIKLDKKGKLIWNKRVQYEDNYGSSIGDITAAPQNGLLIAMTSYGCESYCNYSSHYRFSFNGEINWALGFSSPNLGSNRTLFTSYDGNNLQVISEITNRRLEPKRLMITSVTDNKQLIDAHVVDNNIFSLKYFLKNKQANYIKDNVINLTTNVSSWVINSDWSLTTTNYAASEPFYVTLTKYDTLDRLCPKQTRPIFNKKDSSINLSLIYFKPSTTIPNLIAGNFNMTVQDYKLSYEILCSSSSARLSITTSKLITNTTEITLSPNPTSNVLNINGLKGNNNISVVSMNGKILQEHNTATNSYRLNINNLKAGMYLLKINDGKQIQVKKFIKN